MRFDAPLVVLITPLVGLVVAGLAVWARRARVAHARRWSAAFGARAAGLGRLSPLAIGVAAGVATFALAGPRWGSRQVTTETKSLNLVIAMDISRSMLAEDARPSRLQRAKRQAERLVHDLAGDRVGLIAFAGQSYILSPLTVDGAALRLLIDALEPGIASSGGTALAPMLAQAGDLLFAGDEVADRVLVVFSDGEAHDTLPAVVATAQRLRRDGVRVVLVAEGGRDPVPIPVRDPGGTVTGYQRDPSGQYVATARRDDVLAAVADAARGVVVTAELSDQAGAVRDLVADFKRSPQATTTAAQDVSRAWLAALVAVAVLLGHTFTRRSLALAGLALLLAGAPRPAAAQASRDRAERAWRAGDFRRAAQYYLARARDAASDERAWFNAGTAALAVGDTALTARALERAARSHDPDVRFRALYNLGLLRLRLAARDSAAAAAHLALARGHLREALLLRPADGATKWNLELAVRRTPPQAAAPPPQGGATPPPPEDQRAGGLSRAQAEQILNSIAEQERRTRVDQVRSRSQVMETRGRREW